MREEQDYENPENEEAEQGAPESSSLGKLRLPWYEGFGMIILAIFFDIIGVLLNLVGALLTPVGGIGVLIFIINSAVSVTAYAIFFWWFWSRGVFLTNWVAILLWIVGVSAEVAPGTSALPFLTLNIFINIVVTYSEDLTGIKFSNLALLNPKLIVRRAKRLSAPRAAALQKAMAAGQATVGKGRRVVRTAQGRQAGVSIPRGVRMAKLAGKDNAPRFYNLKTNYKLSARNIAQEIGKTESTLSGREKPKQEESGRPSNIVDLPQKPPQRNNAPPENSHKEAA